MVILAAGGAYYHFVYAPAHALPVEAAYVLAESAEVVDTPAEVRLDVAEVKSGDKVQVLRRTRNWAHIRLAGGQTGWLESKDLLDSQTFERGQELFREMERIPPQAAGHAAGEVNAHLEPSREAQQLVLLKGNEKVQIYGRRLVAREPQESEAGTPAEASKETPSTPLRDAWYLVRDGSRGGWVLGRFIALDIPPEIEIYAEGTNTVAWLVLSTANDNGREVPDYLVADRVGTQEFDFNHIRVFNWWIKNQHYVTAYVESNLDGYFPIRTSQVEGRPSFRLRLVDTKGHKFQKVYEKFDTIVRPVGTVDGWESDAMPTGPPKRSKRRR